MRNLSSILIKFFCIIYFISFSILSQASSTASAGKFHVCFFELDNQKTSQNFEAKAKGTVVHKYTIKRGEKGREAFERMIKEGKKCDGLVFSGHHTGDWFGKNGSLFLKDMEELSCNEKYRDWFKSIKALWLDGCNTVTDKWGEDVIKGTKPLKKSSDSELVRVLGKEVADKTKLDDYNIRAYAQSYTASLDENTPLSSRYLRMFPDTQVYGFNGAAPSGDQQVKQSAIFNHLTKLGKAINAEDSQNGNSQNKDDFLAGIDLLLSSDDFCTKIEKWEEGSNHQAIENQDYTDAYKLACDLIKAKKVLDNPNSLEAAKSLANAIIKDSSQYSNKTLQLANSILKNPKNSKKAVELAKKTILKTLKTINKQDEALDGKNNQLKYSHILFNNIYDTWKTAQKYEDKDSKFFENVKKEFRKKTFTNSLKTRIESKYTASLKKGDYIKFYAEIHNVNIDSDTAEAAFITEHIGSLVAKAASIFKDLKSPRQGNLDKATRRTLSASVVDQLLQYNLLTGDHIKQLLSNKDLFPPKTDHLFVRDVHTKLKFKQAVERKQEGIVNLMLPPEEKPPDWHLQWHSNLRAGTDILLAGDSPKKDEFRQLIDVINKEIKKEGKEGKSVVSQVLFEHLQGKSEGEKIKYLLKFSEIPKNNTEKEKWESFQAFIFFYAWRNLPESRSSFKDLKKSVQKARKTKKAKEK